jgi:hypothetical protein
MMGDDDEGGMALAMVGKEVAHNNMALAMVGEEVAHNNQIFLQTLILECTHPKIGSGFFRRLG